MLLEVDNADAFMYIVNTMLRKFKKSLEGATAIEYAIIASLLSVVIIIGLEATGVALGDQYASVGGKLENAFETSAGGNGPNPGGSNLLPDPDQP